MNLEEEAETVENMAQQQDVRDVWAGLTVLLPNTADVLGYLDEIPVCTGYEIDGKVTTEFPTTGLLEKAKPVLEVLPGWKSDIRGIKNYDELPENCRNYIEFVEKMISFTEINNFIKIS